MRRFFRFGDMTLIDANGNRHQICKAQGPRLVVRITDQATARRLSTPLSLPWGEAYMDGRLVFDEGNIADFLEVYSKSDYHSERSWLRECMRIVYSIIAATQHYNPIGRAQKNVAHHYDLSAELYGHFLDSDRQYSCAYFPGGNEDLETAQLLKKRHIAAKLDIKPGMKVLDIGSGWGGMGIYLASYLDCSVTGVTLSEEQHKLSLQRVGDAGLAQKINFELRDYRTLNDTYDRIVSVGMLEHVGQFQYGEYFDKLRELLKPDGVALIQTIARMNKPLPINAWMRKYIFPGAYLPSASQLSRAIEHSGLWLTDLENLRLHYAITLDRWNQKFQARRAAVARLYDERFCRMWELYLLGSEMVFRHQDVTVFQLQITRDINTLPITRDYIGHSERLLSEKDSASVSRIRRNKPATADEAASRQLI